MPPKSSNKKSNASAASWYHCETCNVHITSKERETHEQACPIGEPKPNLAYIRDNVLYTAQLEQHTFAVESLKQMPLKFVNNLIFLSEGAMRLSQLHIGQQIVIQPLEGNDQIAHVRAVWPIPEKFLTTVFVTEEDYKLHWAAHKGQLMKISALPEGSANVAKLLQLRLLNDPNDEGTWEEKQLEIVQSFLKNEMKHLIYSKGSQIYKNFFNKPLKFEVTQFQTFNSEANEPNRLLEWQLERLTLAEKPEFVLITNATQIEIESPPMVNEDETATTDEYEVTKADIGGLDKQLKLIEDAIDMALGIKAAPRSTKISRGFLIYGSNGCGKSLICEAMCSEVVRKTKSSLKANIIRINASELFSRYLGETEKNLASYFDKAFTSYPRPSLIVVEDVHNLCPRLETNDVTKRVSAAFQSSLDFLSTGRRKAQHTCLIATTSQIEELSPNLRRYGRLDCEIEINVPMPLERTAILKCLLRNAEHELSAEDIDKVARVAHGFVGADLANLVYGAAMQALKDGQRKMNFQDLHSSLAHVKPSAMREVLIESPNVHWSDIGGQEQLKWKLKQMIEWPLIHPEKFQRLGIKPPRGILMFGPPGCSKTMIAKALATESQLNFLSIKGPELFSMWVGESERAVREVFRKARQVAPAIVFFDEIDAIGGERAEGGNTSVKERVLTQLLTEMDGVEALENVTIVAATNRPDMIDKALLRPGRIDRIIYVGLPDRCGRREIVGIKLSQMPLAKDVNIDELAKRTEGYSGAEIQAVCHEAALKALGENFDAQNVAWQHFEYALKAVQPRTSPELLQLYKEYLKSDKDDED